MSNPTRGARSSEPAPATPKLTNVASGPIMSWENLNAQTFPQHSNPITNAYGEEAKPREIGTTRTFDNTTPNLVRSATKSGK